MFAKFTEHRNSVAGFVALGAPRTSRRTATMESPHGFSSADFFAGPPGQGYPAARPGEVSSLVRKRCVLKKRPSHHQRSLALSLVGK